MIQECAYLPVVSFEPYVERQL